MSQGTVFAAPPEKFSFPRQEEATQLYWDKIDAFKESLRRSEGRKLWTFYDGPPFATGLPHYGHILAGTIKDIVCRYAHQTGHHVERRAGWDCHGLPVEYEIDQKLGIKSREDVLAMGIDKYNDECRAIVMRYSSQWVSTVTRMGRWIDFENDYKTMNIEFMESVWWVFKQIYEKGLVYQGFKVMPYSTTCSTPLSNFEASQNYKEVSDPAVIVGFPIVGEPDGAMLCAWTTTPWTLPSNLALCVHPDWEYAKVKDAATGNHYVLLKSRLSALYPAGKQKKSKTPLYTLVSSVKGDELKGKAYLPPFDYFASHAERGCFRVLADRFVKDDSGTGIVHMAPAFGEEDNRICREAGLVKKDGEGIVCPIDANGRFTSDVPDFCGVYIKEADGKIMEALKARGRLVDKDSITHSYPFCWRSETPLIYRTIPSWFVNVERMKERLLANNEQTYWVPEFVQTKRFHNWLRDARDWAISRNRFWGTPLPIWASEDGEELVVVGSIAELQELSGRSDITDLHRQFIDDVTIPSKRGKGVLRRVDEVFDCWFESGAMPYAQAHYPFENKAKFEASFPADFIAEGLDQTRGWFYTLMVLSTCLFDKPAFKNLIVNGLVLAEDGLKMSKRLKNYPDPIYVINEYGADALRLYLINSPVVCADTLKFKESGVKGIIRDVFLPWYNSFRFFIQSATRLELDIGAAGRFVPDVQRAMSSPNAMDRWIIAAAHSLVAFVRAEMAAYRLYTAVPRILHFVEQLTNWYIKLNRTRLQRKGDDSSVDDCMRALCALYEVLLLVAKLMAPLTPFLADYFYTQLAAALPEAEREQSVHFCMLPDVNEGARDEAIERAVAAIQPVIELGRNIRLRRKKPLKVPLPELVVLHRDGTYLDDVKALERYVISELNVRAVSVRRFVDSADIVALKALPNHTVLGRRFGSAYGGWQAKVKALSHEQLCAFLETKTLTIDGEVFGADDVIVQSEFIGSTEVFEAAASDMKDLLVVLNCVPDQAMLDEGTSRNVSNRVQKLRKEAGLEVQDAIEVFYQVLSPAEAQPRLLAAGMHKSTDAGDEGQEAATAEDAAALDAVVAKMTGMVSKLIGKPFLPLSRKLPEAVVLVQALRDIDGVTIELVIARELAVVRKEVLADGETAAHVQQLLAAYEPVLLKEKLAAEGGKLRFRLNGTEVELEHGTHFALSSLA